MRVWGTEGVKGSNLSPRILCTVWLPRNARLVSEECLSQMNPRARKNVVRRSIKGLSFRV